jgi:protein-tyrosine phosphatase
MSVMPNLLPTTSILNPRDLGGYTGADGRRILMHRLVRTGTLAHISEQDKKFLAHYGVHTIIDLRYEQERQTAPDPVIDGIENLSCPLSSPDTTDISRMKELLGSFDTDPCAALHIMRQNYIDHIRSSHDRQIIRDIITLLCESESGAVLWHCTEGKDRTGLVALFVLYLLGVDLETIRQDYLATNVVLTDYRARQDQRCVQAGKNFSYRANIRILSNADDIYLDAALFTIEQQFGGIDQYITRDLGITTEQRDRLRALYLEP